jgi:hypothetical protein
MDLSKEAAVDVAVDGKPEGKWDAIKKRTSSQRGS